MTRTTILLLWSIVWLCIVHPQNLEAKDLVAGVSHIPPHAVVAENGQPQGGFVDVVKAIDSVYTAGTISIQVMPIKRSLARLANGQIDFHIPYIPNPHVPEETLPFIFSSESVVDVAFVLYTRSDVKMPPMDRLGRLHIETLRGAEPHFAFNISGIDSFRQGISRVSLGRSDGFIGEQDACDLFIRQKKIKNIRRTLYANWKSSIIIGKGPESVTIDRILSSVLRKLKQNGELQKITATIHRPFEDWQPYLANW